MIGHSLGGASSQIVAAEVATHFPKALVAVTTFGGPRPGNKAFARFCARLPNLRVLRVVNEVEQIPRIPWCLPLPGLFRHIKVGKESIGLRHLKINSH